MTNKKIPDKNIYPDFSINNKTLLVKKIEHLIETITKEEGASTQTSIGEVSGVGKNFLGRIKNKHQYTYFDCDRTKDKNIYSFVDNLTGNYPWLNLTVELFWANKSADEFEKQIAITKSILPADFYSGIPRVDYKFSGRKSDIASLKKLIENTSSSLLNITGPACIGKTALLIELARRVDVTIFNKVAWVTARKNYLAESDLISVPQHEIVLDTVLNAIIVQNDDKQDIHSLKFHDKFKLATKLLTENKILLLIDNFELVNDDRIHNFLLQYIPYPSKVIATSRDRLAGFNNYPIARMQPDEINTIIDQFWPQGETRLNKQEIDDLENICDGNLVAIKWILGQVATLNLRLDLIIKNLQADSNTYILDHIFGFTFSKLDAHTRIVLLTLANAPFDVTGNLIANSIMFNYSGEVENLIYDCPDEVEKSLGLLVKFGLVSELKDDHRSTDARISLSSKYRISLITVNYVKFRYKDFDKFFPELLFMRFRNNLVEYDSNSEKDKADMIEFLIIWANIAVAILKGLDLTENPRELKRIYVSLRPFLGIVNTRPQKLPFAIFNVNAAPYNTDAGQAFVEFINRLLLIENKYLGRTGESFFIVNTLHPIKAQIKFNEEFEKYKVIPSGDDLDEDENYEDYMQIRATIIYNDEDIKEISQYNQFTYPGREGLTNFSY